LVATKVSENFLDPKQLREHLEASLKRLQMDYVDLYQIHWHSRASDWFVPWSPQLSHLC
jgi:diketogulonate reductase-like aldo/keto reductase